MKLSNPYQFRSYPKSMKNRARFVFIVIVGLILSALISRNGNILILAFPFIAYLGIGILHFPPKMELRTCRKIIKNQTDGVDTYIMQVAIENCGATIENLYLDNSQFQNLELIDGCLNRRVAILAKGRVEFNYTFRARRGIYSWRTIRMVASDPFGLFEVMGDALAPAEIQVPPEQMKLQDISLRPHFTQHTTGLIPARLPGSGINFWDVREYVPGDSLRWLNWRMTARHPGKLFTKEFEREEIANIGLVLDARALADRQTNEGSLFEYSVQATASLAELFLKNGNRVGLLIFGNTVSTLFPGYGKHQLYQIRRNLSRATASSNLTLTYLQHISMRLFSGRSLIIFISPVTSADIRTFQQLRAFGYQILLISPDPVDFVLREGSQDYAGMLAGRAARVERFLLLNQLLRAGVRVVNWQVDRPLSEAIQMSPDHTRHERYSGR